MTIEGPTTTPTSDPTHLDEQVLEAPPTARRMRRRRRPSGTAAPLPRSIGTTGTGWLVASGLLVAWGIVAYNSPSARRATDRLDAAILRQIAQVRTAWLTDVMSPIARFSTGWGVTAVAGGLMVALIVLKRWRHLFTFV